MDYNIYRSDDYARIRAALVIDSNQIDKELVEFPMLMLDVCEALAECTLARERLEQKYKMELALAQASLRDTPMPDGKKRPETAVASEAPLARGVQEALSELEDGKASVSYWNALLSAMLSKQSSIKRLAELTAAGFRPSASSYAGDRAALAEKRSVTPRATLK